MTITCRSATLFYVLHSIHMAKVKRADKLIGLRCNVCKRRNYYSTRNKKTVERKIELSKYCKWCKKHTPHKEVKLGGK